MIAKYHQPRLKNISSSEYTYFYKQLHFRPLEAQIFENRSNLRATFEAQKTQKYTSECPWYISQNEKNNSGLEKLTFHRNKINVAKSLSHLKQLKALIPKILSNFIAILRLIFDIFDISLATRDCVNIYFQFTLYFLFGTEDMIYFDQE